MSTTMASLDDVTTDSILRRDDLTTNFPSPNITFNFHNFDFNFLMNDSMYPGMNCYSGGPNNVGRYISMILYTVVCIIGLFGNSLVI